MKFIHTSDWHLGRTFHNVSLIDDQKYILLQLTQYLADHPDIEAVIVSGDIYDRSVPPTVAIELLNDVVDSICQQLKRPLILIPGNHDSATRLGFAASHMIGSGLYILSAIDGVEEPVILNSSQGERVAFYGIPYIDPEFIRNHYDVDIKTHDEMYHYLVEKITSQWDSTQPNVLIAHCFVDGAEVSDSERPLSLGGLDRVDFRQFSEFDYVALGHLHQPQKRGHDYIRYSGSLLKYSFSEHRQKKSMTLVELNCEGFVSATPIAFSPKRNVRIIEGQLDTIIEEAELDNHRDDYLLIRLTDQHAILDPMEKLRAVYRNVLHIEKPGMLGDVLDVPSSTQLRRGEFDMFSDFFSEIQGQKMTDDQQQSLKDVLSQLRAEGEG